MTLAQGDHIAKIKDGQLITDEGHREFEVIHCHYSGDDGNTVTILAKIVQ